MRTIIVQGPRGPPAPDRRSGGTASADARAARPGRPRPGRGHAPRTHALGPHVRDAVHDRGRACRPRVGHSGRDPDAPRTGAPAPPPRSARARAARSRRRAAGRPPGAAHAYAIAIEHPGPVTVNTGPLTPRGDRPRSCRAADRVSARSGDWESLYLPPLPPGRGRGPHVGPGPPSSSGLGFRPFKAATRVRIPLGAHNRILNTRP
jgi:hypothetical protein